MALATIDRTRYELETRLCSGCLVRDIQDGMRYVHKPIVSFVDPAVPEQLADVWHAGIPRCLGQTVDEDGTAYCIFEYINGVPLTDTINHNPGGIDPGVWLPWMIQWSQMLSYLHLQREFPLVHLDIKPANLIVDRQSDVGLIDFGAARLLDGRECSGPLKGKQAMTMNYAAPELVAGTPCPGSDLFALGLVMLVLLTGKKPEECRDKPLSASVSGQPAALQTLIGKCLHSDPAMRYNQADALISDLKMIYDQLKIEQTDNACDLKIDDKGVQQDGQSGVQISAKGAADGQVREERLPAPLLCVWDGAACGCELAAVLAERHSVLVIDANLLNPRADLLLGHPHRFYRDQSKIRLNGLDLAMQAEQQGRLTPQLLTTLARDTSVSRVRLLDCTNQLDDYEYCHLDSLHQTLKWARLIADLVIVLCTRSVFDAFTCLCLLAADKVVIPLAGDVGSFREVKRSLEFLSARNYLEQNRLAFVAFPYNKQTDLSRGTMNELSDGRLAGVISEQRQRRLRGCGAVPYAACLSDANKKEYRSLIAQFDLLRQERKGD
ncbi:MAG: protein kinase [Bacillota bacterium]|nr:protein kinase [Bacillota bacterium]